MTIEAAQYINQLNVSYPRSTDLLREGDDHIRMIKNTIQNTFPNVRGEVKATHDFFNALSENLLVSAGGIALTKGFSVVGGQKIDLGRSRVSNVGTPQTGNDAATKAYVDSAVSQVSSGGGGGGVVDAYSRSESDIKYAHIADDNVFTGSNTFNGAIDFGGAIAFKNSVSVGEPTTLSSAATKKYVDDTVKTVQNVSVKLASDNVFTGNNEFTKVLKVATPTSNAHAATKKYVDDEDNAIKSKLPFALTSGVIDATPSAAGGNGIYSGKGSDFNHLHTDITSTDDVIVIKSTTVSLAITTDGLYTRGSTGNWTSFAPKTVTP